MTESVTEILITELRDEHTCENCGWSKASGWRVDLTYPDHSSHKLFHWPPYAYCYGSDSFDERDMFVEILSHLGYKVQFIEPG